MQRSALVWGLVLILFGGLLVLGRLGMLTFSVWAIIWPLIIIAVGLSWLFREAEPPDEESPAPVGPVNVVMQLKGAESAEITLHPSPSGLTIDGTAAPDELLHGSFPGGLDYRAHDLGQGHVGLDLRPSRDDERPWQIALNPAVPLTVILKMPEGEGVLDLTSTQVSDLNLQTTSGRIVATLPERPGRTSVEAVAGSGIIELHIPPNVAGFIQRSATGTGQLEVDAGRFPPQGDAHSSADYETAESWVDVMAAPGSGRIVVD